MVLVVIYSSGGSSAGGVGREDPDAYRRRRERSKLGRLFCLCSAETSARAGVSRDGQTGETRARSAFDRIGFRGELVSPRARGISPEAVSWLHQLITISEVSTELCLSCV